MNFINLIWNKILIENNIKNIQELIKYINKHKNLTYHKDKINNLLIINLDWKYPMNFKDDYSNLELLNNITVTPNLEIINHMGIKIYDSLRDNFTLEDIIKCINLDNYNIYKSYEGTTINIFFYNKWYISTRNKFDIFKSYYGSTKSHGQMLAEIIDIKFLLENLNKNYIYSFLLIHKENSHLINNEENKLILMFIKNKDLYTNEMNDENVSPKLQKLIHLPELVSLKDFESNDDELKTKGIIIAAKNNMAIYNIYNKTYEDIYKYNPKFNSIQEELIISYKRNLIDINDYNYKLIFHVIKFLHFLIYKLIYHFTEFTKENNKFRFNKINNQDYYLIKKSKIIIKTLNDLQKKPLVKNIDKILLDDVINYVNNLNEIDLINLYKSSLDQRILNLVKINISKYYTIFKNLY